MIVGVWRDRFEDRFQRSHDFFIVAWIQTLQSERDKINDVNILTTLSLVYHKSVCGTFFGVSGWSIYLFRRIRVLKLFVVKVYQCHWLLYFYFGRWTLYCFSFVPLMTRVRNLQLGYIYWSVDRKIFVYLCTLLGRLNFKIFC